MTFFPGEAVPAGLNVPPPVISAPQVVGPAVVATAPPEKPNYWRTPEPCHPGTQAYHCPITLYVILVIIGLIIITWALLRAPRKNRDEKDIGTSELWVAFFVGWALYLTLAILFGWWIFEQCRSCNTGSSGITFLLVLLVPVALVLITSVIMGAILGVGFLLTASREPNRSG